MVGLYCGSLAYANLGRESKVTEIYGEKYMEVTPEPVCSCALELSNVGTENEK